MLGYQRGSKCPVVQSRVSKEQGFTGYSKHTDFILKRRLLCVCMCVCLCACACWGQGRLSRSVRWFFVLGG